MDLPRGLDSILDRMGDVVDINQFRRARRLFELLVGRFGVDTFIELEGDPPLRIDPAQIRQAVGLAAAWLELQTGRAITEATHGLMTQQLRRCVIQALAERLVKAGY